MTTVNDLELAMVRMGFDFETYGGLSVRLKDNLLAPFVPVGVAGEVVYTVPGAYAEVQVRWKSGDCCAHRWSDITKLGSKEKGNP